MSRSGRRTLAKATGGAVEVHSPPAELEAIRADLRPDGAVSGGATRAPSEHVARCTA